MKDSLSTKVMRAVDKDQKNIVDFLGKLVRTPSISGQEKEIATLIRSHMANCGFKDHAIDSVGNVIGSTGEGRKKLLFDSHLDHVPPEQMPEPYSAKIIDGERFGVSGEVMYGRGTCDTKASVCSMIMACKILIDQGVKLNGSLTVAGVVMEEFGGSLGTTHLLEEQVFDAAVIGEPSDLHIALGQRGGAFLHLDVKGQSGHVARAQHCVNAFEKSIELMNEINKKVRPNLKADRRLGKTALSFTNAEVQPGFVSIIPDGTVLSFDMRYTLGYTPEHMISDVRRIIKQMHAKDPLFQASVDYMTSKLGDRDYNEDIPPFYTNPRSTEIRITQEVTKEVLGHTSKSVVWPFATDGGFVSRKGITTVGFGPGDYRFVHGPNEHVKLQSVIAATKIYALLALRILGYS